MTLMSGVMMAGKTTEFLFSMQQSPILINWISLAFMVGRRTSMSIASKTPISFRLRLDMAPVSVVSKMSITSIVRGPLGFYKASANQLSDILCHGVCNYSFILSSCRSLVLEFGLRLYRVPYKNPDGASPSNHSTTFASFVVLAVLQFIQCLFHQHPHLPQKLVHRALFPPLHHLWRILLTPLTMVLCFWRSRLRFTPRLWAPWNLHSLPMQRC